MEHGTQRTYQFISDPTHKINLSGRVSAACANCRKKKIKCDGTTNCRQCREKNLECVPAPTRRRPKRDRHLSSGEASTAAATTASLALRRSAPAASSSTRSSGDPGAQTSSRSSVIINPQQSRTPSDDATSGAAPSPNASSSSAEQRISRSISPRDRSVAAFAHPRLDGTIRPAPGRPTLQDSRSSGRTGWPAHRSAPDVFSGAAQGHPGPPRSAARAFEDEAHSLRQLASSRDDFPHPDNVPGPPQEPPRGPYLGLTEQQRFAMGLPEQNVNLRSGLTPLLSDYSQWWDTQSAAAPYQLASPYLPTTQAESLSFSEHPSYHQSQQRDEDQPDQQDPPWSRRA